jgi:mannitol/fructose-specific phosphotransferase system IIA component (Ntr-type)
MLCQFLTIENIKFMQFATDWQAAIRLAAEPLVTSGAVTPAYVESMISSVLTTGPYIVIDEGFAIPHARPEDGALKAGMSMLLLREPVDLLGEKVCVFVALAAADSTSHISALKELAELIWKGGSACVLSSLEDSAAVEEFFKTHSVNTAEKKEDGE